MNSKKFDRREVLKIMGYSTVGTVINPLDMLLESIIRGFGNAYAQSTGNPNTFIQFFMSGGAVRWGYDLPLTPFLDDVSKETNFNINTDFTTNYFPNPGATAANLFAGHKSTPIYNVWNNAASGIKYYYPLIWESMLPAAGGGTRSMLELSQSMAIIRGYNMVVDAHETAPALVYAPFPGQPTLEGLMADNSNRSIPSVGIDESSYITRPYKSNSGGSLVKVSNNVANPLAALFGPFQLNGPTTYNTNIEAQVDQIMNSLSASNSVSRKALYNDRKKAITLFKSNISGLQAVYASSFMKYETLVYRAIHEIKTNGVDAQDMNRLAGQFSNGSSSSRFNFGEASGTFANTATTFDGLLNSYGNGATGIDINQANHTHSTITNLASSFAVLEYIIQNDVSSSVHVSMDGWDKFNFGSGAMAFDGHDTGSASTAWIYTKMYRAFAACMLELIDSIGAAKYGKTVMNLTSEFHRYADGHYGSQHYAPNCSTSIYSGMIKEPLVVGNIKDGDGYGSATPEMGGGQLSIKNVNSTLAHLLDLPPLTNATSDSEVITKATDAGGNVSVSSKIGLPKNDPGTGGDN